MPKGISILLFSGGVDSTALAKAVSPDILLTIDYGQVTASSELKASTRLALELGIDHHVLKTDFSEVGAGTLAKSEASDLNEHSDWWPYRNQMLLTIGAAWAVKAKATKVYIGTVKSDSCFSDGTEEFIAAMNKLLSIQEGEIAVEAPAIKMTSNELIEAAEFPARLLPLCFSCSKSEKPCGRCRGCTKYCETLHRLDLL